MGRWAIAIGRWGIAMGRWGIAMGRWDSTMLPSIFSILITELQVAVVIICFAILPTLLRAT